MSETNQVQDFNAQVIEDFRANAGAVEVAMGGIFAGKPVLLLHTTGAKTGKERLNPLVYATHGVDLVVAASKGGAPTDPHWLTNLRADPRVTIEVGTETFAASATIVEDGPARDELYAKMVAIMPQYADYEARTDRTIPVVVLERTA